MLNIPIYGNKKLITAFEYGLIFSELSKRKGSKFKVTKENVERLEKIILKEFPKKDWERLNTDMIVNILASMETK